MKKNEKTNQLNRSQLKDLMQLYFTTTGSLLCWKPDQDFQALEEQVLDLILAIHGKEEYRAACLEIIRETDSLQTVMDCTMLRLAEDVISKDKRHYFEMKAEALREYKVESPATFDLELMVMDNRQDVLEGEQGAIRLGAMLSWLGIDRKSSPEAAIRHWTLLAYTGDYFAMRALEYAFVHKGNRSRAAMWRTVREICEEADRQFTITVPTEYLRKNEGTATDTAQLILAVRSRCAGNEGKKLPIPMLQYVIESQEDLGEKLHNLYADPETYHILLVQQSRLGGKQYGF